MNSDASRHTLDDVIAVDEIGLSLGVLGAVRLKTAFQPIFARQGSTLSPVAVSATVVMQREGKAFDAAASELTAEEQHFSTRIGRRLAVRNLDHIGCEDPRFDLLLDLSVETDGCVAELDSLLAHAAMADVEPRRLCFDLSGSFTTPAFDVLTERLEKAGAGFALDLAAASNQQAEAAAERRLVRIPADWTRGIVGEADLLRLFRLLVTTLKRRGTVVQVEGITDATLLRAALAAGADRLQGDYLGKPALAGTDFDDSPRALADLIGGNGNVVPLSA